MLGKGRSSRRIDNDKMRSLKNTKLPYTIKGPLGRNPKPKMKNWFSEKNTVKQTWGGFKGKVPYNVKVATDVASKTSSRATEAAKGVASSKYAKEIVDYIKKGAGGLKGHIGKASPAVKIGLIAGGSWLALAILSRELRSISSALMPDDGSPPGHIREVYSQIDDWVDSTPYYDPSEDRRIRAKLNSNTLGTVQSLHRQRSGHHRYGGARTRHHSENLYDQALTNMY